jgi:hypothetical protein
MALADLGIGMDQYDRNARLKPALLVVLPAALAVIAVAPEAVLGWSGGIALIVQAGGSFLLAQIVGDIGKKKETTLFEYFGGRPSELLLHHAHAPNKVLLAERRRKLSKLFPKIKLPSADQEERDPKAAIEAYTACVDKLRGMARSDKEKFPHVHRENIHYGFRRNLWAVKPYGIAVAIVAVAVVCAEMVGRIMSHEQINLAQPVIVGINGLLISVWFFIVTRSWVKRGAMLYAERLLEVLDV